MTNVDLTRVTPAAKLAGEDEEDTELLKKMYVEAETYLKSFRWCPGIAEAYIGLGVGGVVAVFLFRLAAPVKGSGDEWLWVVVGDLPSAYFVTDNAPDPGAALKVYCRLMQEWVDAVRSGEPLDHVFPVDAPADEEHAAMLASRVAFIRTRIVDATDD